MICEYQFYEAKVIGADAVLLITAILDDAQMHDFISWQENLNLMCWLRHMMRQRWNGR